MYGNTNSLIPLLAEEYLGCSQFVIKDYLFLSTLCLPFKMVCLLAYSSSPVSPVSSFHACRGVGHPCASYQSSPPKKLLSSPHSLLELKFHLSCADVGHHNDVSSCVSQQCHVDGREFHNFCPHLRALHSSHHSCTVPPESWCVTTETCPIYN